MGNVKLKGSLGCSDREMVQFKILSATRREHSSLTLTTLDFRRADFGLLGHLLCRVPWDKALQERGAQGSCLVFKDHLFQVVVVLLGWPAEFQHNHSFTLPSSKGKGEKIRCKGLKG